MAILRTLREHYRYEKAIEAINALEDPSEFEALKRRDSREIILQLFFIPSFEPITSWTVYRAQEDIAHIRRIRWDFAEDHAARFGTASVIAADGILPEESLESILKPLSDLTFPPFRSSGRVVIADGESYGIRRVNHGELGEVWWTCRPDGWEEAAAWYDATVETLQTYLPKSNDPYSSEAIR